MVETVIQIKSEITINVDAKKKKKTLKDKYIWNPATCSCKNGKYLASITDDSVITSDEIVEEIKQLQESFNERKVACKTQNFYILLPFSIITIALLLPDKIKIKTKIFITMLRHK